MRFDSKLESVELVAIGEETVRGLQRQLVSCEQCDPLAAIPFEQALHGMAGRDRLVTECVLCEPAQCPNCNGTVIESTLVRFDNETEAAVIRGIAGGYDASPDQTDVVLVDAVTLLDAESRIVQCENCCENAEISFDYILDAITGSDPTVTEYIACRPAKCPNCLGEVSEKTLVVLG